MGNGQYRVEPKRSGFGLRPAPSPAARSPSRPGRKEEARAKGAEMTGGARLCPREGPGRAPTARGRASRARISQPTVP